MASRSTISIGDDDLRSKGSIVLTERSLLGVFSRIISHANVVQSSAKRDKYTRLTPKYNENYDLYKPQPSKLSPDYSPYVFGEPLFDDKPVIITRLPKYYLVALLPKKPRTSWL